MESLNKNIVVEISGGIITAVYCPDGSYIVDILDRDDMNIAVNEVKEYYQDVEDMTKKMKNCY
jgi:hypothetical protein